MLKKILEEKMFKEVSLVPEFVTQDKIMWEEIQDQSFIFRNFEKCFHIWALLASLEDCFEEHISDFSNLVSEEMQISRRQVDEYLLRMRKALFLV